ncbi:MAG: FAD-binding protein, partial [Melioribacteraceae bacterium]|nr:FAD-binding protein [Melioribacteraceae bacterium]
MVKEIEFSLPPDLINNNEHHLKLCAKKLKVNPHEITAVKIQKRSVDARKKPVFRLKAAVFINQKPVEDLPTFNFTPVKSGKRVLIVGSGPAGLFAALRLIELGIKPIILERGKNVRDRRFDIKAIMRDGIVNSESNYCFGEGGAGTYSDGKLYTRSNKRGSVKRIIELLILHGADENIRIDSHPHIGSNKLPKIVKNIRETILHCEGEFRFNSKVTDFIINDGKMKGVVVNNNHEIIGDAVILATGHSSRDIYNIFRDRKLRIEAKPFAMGVRIEHPQSLIDSIQYKSESRHENLPASSYNLTCQIN